MLFFGKKKWKMYLYLNGVCVGSKRISENENPNDNIYIVRFWFKKHIFKTNYVKCVIHPTTILKTEETKKHTHWNFEYEKGVEL